MTMIETSGRTAGPDRQTGPDRQAAGPDRQAASPKTGRRTVFAALRRGGPDRTGPRGRHAAGNRTGPAQTTPDQTGPAQRPAGLPAQTAGPAAPGVVNGPQGNPDRWATEQATAPARAAAGPDRQAGPAPKRAVPGRTGQAAGQAGPAIVTSADRTAGPRRTGPAQAAAGPARRTAGPVRSAEQAAGRPGPRERLDKLTADRGPWARFGLRLLLVLIAVSLVFVVIAPPTLSAKDIVEWAKTNTVQAGLGLTPTWALFTFVALDMAAAVCVLVVLYCALVGARAGVFRIYVWVFAGASAYANYSQGTIDGAAGDKWWFFPLMSVIGPALLESVMHLVRHYVREVKDGAREPRPVYPLVDWFPITGSPQETFGAWRVGGALGIAHPDDALWAFRALTADRGWVLRWWVRSAIRKHQRTAMAEAGPVYLPALLPPGSLFTALLGRTADEHDQTADWSVEEITGPDRAADWAVEEITGPDRAAEQAAGPGRTDRTGPEGAGPSRATAPVPPAAPTGPGRWTAGPDRTDRAAAGPDRAAEQAAGPGRRTAGPDRAGQKGQADNSVPIAHGAELIIQGLTKIRDTFGGEYGSWEAFLAAYRSGELAQNAVARRTSMGKDRINKKLIPHASEEALPWEAGQTAQPNKLAAAASN